MIEAPRVAWETHHVLNFDIADKEQRQRILNQQGEQLVIETEQTQAENLSSGEENHLTLIPLDKNVPNEGRKFHTAIYARVSSNVHFNELPKF